MNSHLLKYLDLTSEFYIGFIHCISFIHFSKVAPTLPSPSVGVTWKSTLLLYNAVMNMFPFALFLSLTAHPSLSSIEESCHL